MLRHPYIVGLRIRILLTILLNHLPLLSHILQSRAQSHPALVSIFSSPARSIPLSPRSTVVCVRVGEQIIDSARPFAHLQPTRSRCPAAPDRIRRSRRLVHENLKDPPKPYIVTRKLYRTTQSWTSYCLAPTHSLLSLSPLTPAPCLLLLPLLAGLHCYSTNIQPQRPGTRLLQPTYRLYPPHHHYHGSQKHTPITAFTTALASLH